jgi:hypothetical protein
LTKDTKNFKNASGQLYTKRLFLEQSYDVNDKTPTIYTLKDEDYTTNGVTYVSLYKRYLEFKDVSEYFFARTFFESYEHFKMLCECSWFKPHIERWRRELSLTIRAAAINSILDVSRDVEHKNYFEANKMILSGAFEDKRSTRGRPSKEEVAQSVKEMAKEDFMSDKDYERLVANQ